jgi:hypothetical protein
VFGLPLEQSSRFKALPRVRDSLTSLRLGSRFRQLGDRHPFRGLHRCQTPEEFRQSNFGGAVEVSYADTFQVVPLYAVLDPPPDAREVRLLTLDPRADPGRFLESQQCILHRIDHCHTFPAEVWARNCSSSAFSSASRRLADSSSCSSSCSRFT